MLQGFEAKIYQDGFMKMPLFLSLALVSLNAHALMDYSEPVDAAKEEKSSSQSSKSYQKMSTPKENGGGRSLTWKADLSLATNYETLEIEGQKYGMINAGLHIQTPVNIFFDASYWTASGSEGTQNGNPKLILGFNWLRFGSPGEEARLDLYGGVKLSSSSKLGSSRMDKIVGAETTKRFGTFGLGLGYDVTLVGLSKNDEEKSIGNINRLTVSGGWMVSNDIQFEIEVENFSINSAKDSSHVNRLTEKASWSTLSPKLNLGLATAVNLEIGARFRMKKPKAESELLQARVFDLHGSNANSLFAGLNFTI